MDHDKQMIWCISKPLSHLLWVSLWMIRQHPQPLQCHALRLLTSMIQLLKRIVFMQLPGCICRWQVLFFQKCHVAKPRLKRKLGKQDPFSCWKYLKVLQPTSSVLICTVVMNPTMSPPCECDANACPDLWQFKVWSIFASCASKTPLTRTLLFGHNGKGKIWIDIQLTPDLPSFKPLGSDEVSWNSWWFDVQTSGSFLLECISVFSCRSFDHHLSKGRFPKDWCIEHSVHWWAHIGFISTKTCMYDTSQTKTVVPVQIPKLYSWNHTKRILNTYHSLRILR